jgi:hypothetical protein
MDVTKKAARFSFIFSKNQLTAVFTVAKSNQPFERFSPFDYITVRIYIISFGRIQCLIQSSDCGM